MRGLRHIAESMSAYRNVGKCIVKKAIPNKTAVILNSLIIPNHNSLLMLIMKLRLNSS